MDYQELAQLLYGGNSKSESKKTPDKYKKYMELLKKNSHMNFVQRLLNPSVFPVMHDVLEPGDIGSHLMSSGEYDGKGIVYPEIIQEPNTRKLKRLGRREAMDYAISNNEYLSFDDPAEAEDFGKNYKSYLGIYGY